MSASRHAWRWVAAAALVIAALCFWAVLKAAWFLEAPASPPTRADLMVVLGGDSGDRALTAARLYADGFAPRVLVTGIEESPREVRRAYLNWRVQVMAEAGVPLDRFEYDAQSGNSLEEAFNTRRLMQARGWRRALVVSDPYHMRRLSWAWGRAFEGSGLEYSLAASSPAFWKPDAWWRDEKSGQAVIVEYIKLGYYLVKPVSGTVLNGE